MSRFGGLVPVVLCVASWMAVSVPQASAHYGYSTLSYSNNKLVGYSQSHVEAFDWGWDCLAPEVYDPIADDYYCPENGWWFGWGGVDGYLYTEGDVLKFSDSDDDYELAEVEYDFSPDEYGQWRAHADYIYGEDFYFSECWSFYDCEDPYYVEPSEVPPDIYDDEDKYATVELIQVTNFYWGKTEFTAPGCVAVIFEPSVIEAADIEWHHDEDNVTDVAEGWGQGQESCVEETADYQFGHYQINKARAVGLFAWYTPPGAPPAVWIQAPIPIVSSNAGNGIWHFNGESPSGYPMSLTLTSSRGSNTTWAKTGNTAGVTLSSTTGTSITVTSSGSSFSSMVGDIGIVATQSGRSSATFAITTRRPESLLSTPLPTPHTCDTTWGYISYIQYRILDNLGDWLPSTLDINEQWTTNIVPDWPNANWRRIVAGGGTSLPNSLFYDTIGGELASYNPTRVCGVGSNSVQHWGQSWRIGSSVSGDGSLVRSHTFQKYLGHAVHIP
jgi:hypothetical protein